MNLHPQKRSITLCAVLACSLPIIGCSQSHPSAAWQGSGMYAGNAGTSNALVYSPALEGTGNLIYIDRNAPEYSRRDHTLSTMDTSRREDLFGVRAETRPSLNNRRTYYGSRRAEDYTYPSTEPRGSHGYRRYYRD